MIPFVLYHFNQKMISVQFGKIVMEMASPLALEIVMKAVVLAM
jgi:hypothetical protein